MVVVGLEIVQQFLKKHNDCSGEVQSLIQELRSAKFGTPLDLANRFPAAKVLDGRNVVFKIRGNKYRLTATVAYQTGIVVVVALETHAEYDRRDIR